MLFSVSGCGTQADTPLRLGLSPWPGYDPLYLAQSSGYLDPEKVVLIDSTSPNGSIQGLRNGDLDAAALTLDEVLVLVDQKVPLQVVLLMDFSNGGDALLARKGITDLSALRGGRIGLENSVLGNYLLGRALERHGMSSEEVALRYLDVNEQLYALMAGEVDAVVSYEPVRSQLLAAGAHELFSSRELPYEIVDVLVVRDEVLASQPGRVHHLVAAWYRAIESLAAQPQQSAGVLGVLLQKSTGEVLQGMAGIELPGREEALRQMRPQPSDGTSLEATVSRLGAIMHGRGMLQRIPNPRALINADFL